MGRLSVPLPSVVDGEVLQCAASKIRYLAQRGKQVLELYSP